MANKTISLDPAKTRRARTGLYVNPKAMALDSSAKNYKISERTIRSIEDGKIVKLSTAENYATILGYTLKELGNNHSIEDNESIKIDISSTQIFGSCSNNLLTDWRSHYSAEEQPPWNDLDIIRGTEREMTSSVEISTLKPASIDQIINCANEYKSKSQTFLQNSSDSHGLGGKGNQVPFIRLDLIWLIQPTIKSSVAGIKILEQVQQGLAKANSSLSEEPIHSAESMIQQVKTNSTIKELVTSLNYESQLHFLYGELSSECVETFTKKTLSEGEFQYSTIKRKVLMLCHNSVELTQVMHNAWKVPK
tara:strand:- start:539 stop:1459 length:921 start_codon:yes stop_codon:yes gene_type:complete